MENLTELLSELAKLIEREKIKEIEAIHTVVRCDGWTCKNMNFMAKTSPHCKIFEACDKTSFISVPVTITFHARKFPRNHLKNKK